MLTPILFNQTVFVIQIVLPYHTLILLDRLFRSKLNSTCHWSCNNHLLNFFVPNMILNYQKEVTNSMSYYQILIGNFFFDQILNFFTYSFLFLCKAFSASLSYYNLCAYFLLYERIFLFLIMAFSFNLPTFVLSVKFSESYFWMVSFLWMFMYQIDPNDSQTLIEPRLFRGILCNL